MFAVCFFVWLIAHVILQWVQNQMSAVLAAMPEQDRVLSHVQLQCAWNYLLHFDKPDDAGKMIRESLDANLLQVILFVLCAVFTP